MIEQLVSETELLIAKLDAVAERLRQTDDARLAPIEELVRDAREHAAQLRAVIADAQGS